MCRQILASEATCERKFALSCYLPTLPTHAKSRPIPRRHTKKNQCQLHASNAPQMAPMKDLCLKPRNRKISGMMRGETRDAGHSARVRRADRMRFRSLSESVELQSDRHSRRWSFCRSYNRQSTPTAIGRCARDVDQQNRHEASSLGSHADL